MPLKDGDIVTLDYEGRTEGILFDTTLENVELIRFETILLQ